MTDPASALPLWDRTPLEEAMSLAAAALHPLPTHLVKDVMDPATCPVDLLPYLAAGLGFELDVAGWPEAKLRALCADLWLIKRTKTKLKGIRTYLGLVGADLLAAHRPKDKLWWAGGQSAAQRAATIAEMPQIRVYPIVGPEVGSAARLAWGGARTRCAWGASRAWTPSDAIERYEDRARYVDGGVETPVTVAGIEGPLDPSFLVELRSPASPAKLAWAPSRAWGRCAFVGSNAGGNVVAITPNPGATAFALPSGLIPTTVQPTLTFESAPAPAGKAFWGRFAFGHRTTASSAWTASDADRHVYQLYSLFDPARVAPSRQPYSFWGYSRWGRRPFDASLLVDVPLAYPAARFRFGRAWGRSYWGETDFRPFWDAIAAVRVAKAYRDTVWVDTTLYTPIQFSAGLRFGDPGFKQFGSYRKAT